MSAAIVAGLLAGYGIAIPVGAVGAYLVALTARTSLRVGAAAALGIATVDGGYAIAAVLGGAALAGSIEPYAQPLRWASAAVLLVMAAVGAVAAARRHRAAPTKDVVDPQEPRQETPARAFVTFLGITAINPLTVVYFAALVLGSGARLAQGAEAVVFVAAAFAASASWQLLLAGGGALLGRFVTSPRGRLTTAWVSSAVIVVLAVRMIVTGGE
ncbi:LysE family transporter [Jiangella mangrovi]|uniref:Arginine exporter protein ArgO n=1 Tax=Jiangella mangrovi TaxID=1524084 RepID=A0A7W9LMH6_9ACTN|nr:LysE family transporter [Jiangella mangrovi]MBB5789265.1 arginine exporter protein ArgO [Jiangella mangrovi]